MTKYLVMLSLCISVSGCMTTPALPDAERPQHWGQSIQPVHNFYQISETVFRSEQPDQDLVPSLKAQKIDVIINLRSRNQDLKKLPNQGFKLVHIPIHTWAIDREDLLKVMQQIQHAEQNQQKVLLHCYHGSDRTGASVAMYRIIFQNWSTADALAEMKHGGYGFHPIWQNIEPLFSPENIKWIQQQLLNPS
ncbi:dual specificity protein phosphatase family protein [Acinetobacter johnsonii]|uniref:dual specificity protein phosphatase family protein n=1 Tax=Acinetobacter johnsonii TaxID=40214 RepID=UPI002448B293|nr:dual specificity protein phosphatase family protein [Acinetobacter johnsonii]MDH1069006.1 dual specificity protein phosphatase family protein [Acinetobacter johnsonii]